MLERIDEDNAERKAGTNEQDGDIHQIEVRANVMRVALMSQLRDREQAEQAECKQNRAKRYVHELGHAVNYLVEPLTELIANHESQREHETDGCWQNRICREDHSHSDLRFVARLVDIWVGCHVDHLFFLENLLHDKGVCNDD